MAVLRQALAQWQVQILGEAERKSTTDGQELMYLDAESAGGGIYPQMSCGSNLSSVDDSWNIWGLAVKHSQRKLANAAIIVDPALGEVIAKGQDGTAAWCASCCGGSLIQQDCQHLKESALNYGWHPLQHAVIVATPLVSERDKRLWPAEDDKAMENTGRDSTVLPEWRTVAKNQSFVPKDQEYVRMMSTFEIARPFMHGLRPVWE